MSIKIQTKELTFHEEKILSACDLDLVEGEIHSILGRSGVGKSQLLKQISEIREDVSFVFQTPNLFPWLTIYENLRVSLSESVGSDEIDNILKRFDLFKERNLFPSEISEGMKQKCNLARAILASSNIILMDEPFSALDYFQKESIRSFVKQIFKEYRRSVILVTHDIEEAVFLSHKIFLLKGRPASLSEFNFSEEVGDTSYKDVRYRDYFMKTCNKLRESFEC